MFEELSKYKYILIIEAFLGSFYGAVTRNLYTPMLAYSGYELADISMISFYTTFLNLLLIVATYIYPDYLSKGIKIRLLVLYSFDRLIWMLVPFLVPYKLFVLMFSFLALLISFPLGILFNLAILNVFRYFREQYVDLGVKRSIMTYTANITGSLYVVFITLTLEAPLSYYVAYITSGIVGLAPLPFMILYYKLPESFEVVRETSSFERAEFKAFIVITMIQGFFFSIGGNMLGLAWPIILRDLGFPLYIAMTILLLIQNLVGTLGMLLISRLKNPKYYIAIALLNVIAPALIPYSRSLYIHVALGAMLALGFQGVSLLGLYTSSIRARFISIRFLAISGLPGALASLVSSSLGMISSAHMMVTLSTLFRFLALMMPTLFIPEISILGPSRAYIYELKIYSVLMHTYRSIADVYLHIFRNSKPFLCKSKLIKALIYIIVPVAVAIYLVTIYLNH